METSRPSRRNALLALLPLLLIYGIFVVLKSKPDFQWDEGRYFLNAQNLLKGYFASVETLMFWNGPGYPLYIAPFVALKLPLLLVKLGNAVFLWLAVLYFRASLRLLGVGRALLYAWMLGIFLLLHGSLIEYLMTESLSAFLISGAAHHFLRAFLAPGRPRLHLALAGLHLGYLALTKVFFGYVLTTGIGLGLLTWIGLRIKRGAAPSTPGVSHPLLVSRGALPVSLASSLVCTLGLLVCLPYLVHTYHKTGKVFFWSNSGGSQLYCMTLPEKELLGDWLNFEEVLYFPDFFKEENGFYKELDRMDYLRRDEAFKRAALRNIRAHPKKVFQNWRANLNRMVFGFPESRYPGASPDLSTGNRAVVYALPFFLAAVLAWPAWKRRAALPAALWACLAFGAIAFGGLSLLSAIPRMVFPLMPLLALGLVAVFETRTRV